MAYVVTDACRGCRYTECVTVCPVECFHLDEQMTYIDGEIARSERITRAIHRERSGWWARAKQAGAYFIMSVLDPQVTVRLNRD